jgi:phage baseplate assembly protein W
MKRVSYRSWKFVFADSVDFRGEPPIAPIGFSTTARGKIEMAEDDDAIRQSIKMLLSTMPGERIMNPAYGCDLHKLVFCPNDGTTAGLAMHYIRRALEQWEPRIEILSLDANSKNWGVEKDMVLEIVLCYRIRSLQRDAVLNYLINLNGGLRHVASKN